MGTSWHRTPSLNALAAYPVLSPALNRRGKPGDLLQYPLLHEDDGGLWQRWFQAAGANSIKAPRRMRLNDVALVLQAAAEGQGVALGDDLLAGDDLRARRLIKPFEIEMPCGAYWLMRSRSASISPAQRAFEDWLRSELPSQ